MALFLAIRSLYKILWLGLGLFSIFFYPAVNCLPETNANTCETPGCLEAATRILKNMNTEYDPCMNFHKYACGGYFNRTIVSKTQDAATRSRESSVKIIEIIKNRMQEKLDEKEPRTLKLLQSYYNLCKNAELKIDETEKKQILKTVSELGGWPVLNGKSWNESTFNLDELIFKIKKMGFHHAKNSFAYLDPVLLRDDSRLIKIGGASTGIHRDFFIANSSNNAANQGVEKYLEKMIQYAKLFGADPERAKKELTKSLEFEKQLAKISYNSNNTFVNRSELFSQYPVFPWRIYLEDYLPSENNNETDINYYYVNLDFLNQWSQLVKNTPKEVLANYAIWRVVKEVVDARTDVFGEPDKRDIKCTYFIVYYMPLASGILFIRKDFNKTLRADVRNLVEHIRKSYKQVLSESEWLDETAKSKAISKVESMHASVAYPDEYFDDIQIDNYHKNLTFPTKNYHESWLNLLKFSSNHKIKEFKVTSENWAKELATEMNAIHYWYRNNMSFYAALVHQEYASDRPNYLNYGLMGYIIGHEMTHGFDTNGFQNDINGKPWDLFNDVTYSKYMERVNCTETQFSKYSIGFSGKRFPLNSQTKLNENIADIGGMQVASRSYDDWIKQNGEEPILPGLEFLTPRKLFWIGSASFHCAKTKVSGYNGLFSDSHSPGAFRTVGSFMNIPEFTRDFNCKAGTRMNPEKKCTLW